LKSVHREPSVVGGWVVVVLRQRVVFGEVHLSEECTILLGSLNMPKKGTCISFSRYEFQRI
jgi:hypothetical protein